MRQPIVPRSYFDKKQRTPLFFNHGGKLVADVPSFGAGVTIGQQNALVLGLCDQLYRVASEIPSSWASCLIVRLCGGIILLSTASLRLGEYRMNKPPVPFLIYNGF